MFTPSPSQAKARARWDHWRELRNTGQLLSRREAQKERGERVGYVYFARGILGRYRPVKIGWAADPKRRLSELQRSHPQPLRIIGTIAGTERDERRLHVHFADFRIRGEWFKPAEELLAIAAGHLTPQPWSTDDEPPSA